MVSSPANTKSSSGLFSLWRKRTLQHDKPLPAARCQYQQVPVAPAEAQVPPTVTTPAPSSNRMLPPSRAVKVLTCLGIFGVLVGIIGVATYQPLYDLILNKELVLHPDSPGYPYWYSTPFPIYIKFYFWNVTNSEDVLLQGARPVLQELGPYTYMENHQKVNLHWNDHNHTVTFMQTKTWFFVPEMSNGSVEDPVTTLNIPLLGAADSTKTMSGFMVYMFNTMIHRVGSQPFVTKTVREFLFAGYSDPLLTAANIMKHFLPNPVPYDKFGWFYAVSPASWNGTPYFDGVWNMDTGYDSSKLGNIYSWNFTTRSSAFDAECGALNGSAGELFPAGLKRDQVSFFSTDLCRTLNVPYDSQASIHDLAVNRYSADERMFGSPEVNPDNWCNCHGECLPSGLLDQSKCRFGMSGSRVSFPHMLFVDPSVVNETVGQTPDIDQHNFHIDIEPNTGTSLSVRARFQINILMQANEKIDVLSNLTTVNMPMFWFENMVDTTQDVAEQFITITVTLPLALKVGCWCLTAGGAVVLFAGALLFLRQRATV